MMQRFSIYIIPVLLRRKILIPFLLVAVILLQYACTEKVLSNEEVFSEPEELIQEEPQLFFGLDTSGLRVLTGSVQRNESLGTILNRNGVSHRLIAELADASEDVFDVRRIRTGQPFSIIATDTDTPDVMHFVYEINATDYVVYQLKDSLLVYRDQKEIELHKRTAAGVIESSLYLTLTRNNLPVVLTNQLAGVYAWAIDFHRVQKGDKFKVAFLERRVEGNVVGIERIEYAVFYSRNRPFYAFYYEQDGKGDYFDEEGNSLRKAFLKAPLEYTRISSGFTQRRFHPIQRVYRPHLGVDYAAPTGTPIMSVGDGVVERASYTSGNGNYVKVRHNSVYSTQYLHMSRFANGIRAGVHVKQGDVIGYVGMTGLATGPHLCFRFWKNGVQVNPLTVEVPPAEPINDAYKEEYMAMMEEYKMQLSQIEFKEEVLTAGL